MADRTRAGSTSATDVSITLRSTPATVAFCFGFFERDQVPGPLLVKVMDDLGTSPTTSRALFSRMIARGELESRHTGRVATYQLAGQFAKRFHAVRYAPSGPTWTGAFDTVLYDVAETHRRFRDEVRRQAANHGFASPRPGMLIGLQSPDWVNTLDRPGRAELLEIGQFCCSLGAARRLAETAWQIADHARMLQSECARLEEEVAADEPFGDGALALRSLHRLWTRHAAVTLAVPGLPPELLPDDWARARLQQLTLARSEQHQGVAGDYAESLRSDPRYLANW